MNTALKIITGVTGGVAAYFAVTGGCYLPFVISKATKTYRDDCDYLMILGSNVIGADTPGARLFERMEGAAEYLKENEKCFVIPCGGCFREGQKRSEADIIASYLIENGIDESRILLEDKSTTTVENFKFATKIIEKHSGKSIDKVNVAFLSSSYHIHRGETIAKRCGIKSIGKVSVPMKSDAFKHYLREYFVAYELLNPKKRHL